MKANYNFSLLMYVVLIGNWHKAGDMAIVESQRDQLPSVFKEEKPKFQKFLIDNNLLIGAVGILILLASMYYGPQLWAYINSSSTGGDKNNQDQSNHKPVQPPLNQKVIKSLQTKEEGLGSDSSVVIAEHPQPIAQAEDNAHGHQDANVAVQQPNEIASLSVNMDEEFNKVLDNLHGKQENQWQFKHLTWSGHSQDSIESLRKHIQAPPQPYNFYINTENKGRDKPLYEKFINDQKNHPFDPKKTPMTLQWSPEEIPTAAQVAQLQHNSHFVKAIASIKTYNYKHFEDGSSFDRARISGEYIRIDENPMYYLEILKLCIEKKRTDFVYFDRLVLVYKLLNKIIEDINNHHIQQEQFNTLLAIMATTSGLFSSLFNHRHCRLTEHGKYVNPLEAFNDNNKFSFQKVENFSQLKNAASLLVFFILGLKYDGSKIVGSEILHPSLLNELDVSQSEPLNILTLWDLLFKNINNAKKITNPEDAIKGFVFMMSKLNNCQKIEEYKSDNQGGYTMTVVDATVRKPILIKEIVDNLIQLDKDFPNDVYCWTHFINRTGDCPMPLKATYIASLSRNFIMFGMGSKNDTIGIYPLDQFTENAKYTKENNHFKSFYSFSNVGNSKEFIHNMFKQLDKEWQ